MESKKKRKNKKGRIFIYFKEIKLLEIRNQGQGYKNKYVQMPPSIYHQRKQPRHTHSEKLIFKSKLKLRTPNLKTYQRRRN